MSCSAGMNWLSHTGPVSLKLSSQKSRSTASKSVPFMQKHECQWVGISYCLCKPQGDKNLRAFKNLFNKVTNTSMEGPKNEYLK